MDKKKINLLISYIIDQKNLKSFDIIFYLFYFDINVAHIKFLIFYI